MPGRLNMASPGDHDSRPQTREGPSLTTANSKPTAGTGLEHQGLGTQPHTERSEMRNARTKPIRITVDLDPRDHDALRDFAYVHRMTQTDVVRALVRMLDTPSVIRQVSSGARQ